MFDEIQSTFAEELLSLPLYTLHP